MLFESCKEGMYLLSNTSFHVYLPCIFELYNLIRSSCCSVLIMSMLWQPVSVCRGWYCEPRVNSITGSGSQQSPAFHSYTRHLLHKTVLNILLGFCWEESWRVLRLVYFWECSNFRCRTWSEIATSRSLGWHCIRCLHNHVRNHSNRNLVSMAKPSLTVIFLIQSSIIPSADGLIIEHKYQHSDITCEFSSKISPESLWGFFLCTCYPSTPGPKLQMFI